ncbi:GMC oxidoreductase [Hypholoma sublateritium FD-334 SS-4]|uniref:pyranose dehydrogenase (acceptor) n=1 Tax=Hypholoma sublateritium (strain FD-334 SS-4) TaxID=945553 RepID=A0A0D2M7F2_HYPSF|nr:GMC oxidoreductase [Hypholoma sublateritium FD-334 SS-4]
MRREYVHFLALGLSCLWPHVSNAVTIPDAVTANATQTAANTYDYVVVGSGPGGGPLAARLAQAGYSVLLLDAGEDHATDNVVQIPLLQTSASEYTPITWQFFVSHYDDPTVAIKDPKFTWKQPDGSLWVGPNPPAGSTPLGIYYPRASTLGGCSEHNAMVALYPSEADWEIVANITGDSSWSPSNMRKYWTALENNQYLTPGTAAAATHGFGGWLDVTLTDLRLVLRDARWLSILRGAATVMGTNLATSVINTVDLVASMMVTDVNNASPTRDNTPGIYQVPLSVTNATRARSSQRMMILNTAKKYKLTVQLSTLVTSVIFDRTYSTPRAIGVRYIQGSHLYRADPNSGSATQTSSGSFFARREVILSGGVYNTPQLLKLSGVGPAAELKALNIPVVLNSPGVGTNMQDRYEVTVTGSLATNFASYDGCTFLQTADDPCYDKWFNNSTDHGIYGTNGVAFGIFEKSSVAQNNEVDLFVGGLPANFHGYFPGYSTTADIHTWAYLVLKAHTRNNAGTVTLRTTDPRDMPNINFRSFTVGGDLDLQAVYEGVQLARTVFNHTITPDGPFVEQSPGASITSENDVKDWIKSSAWGHHASCTVPIGAASDPNTPLDSKFRVKGINGLRVVDASVFPKIPDFYIVGAIYVISEKAAAVIIQDAKST